MYSFSYLEPVCCSMSSSNCCFLICIQISQEAGQVVWYSHLFQNFPQFLVIHTVKGFGLVNKAEIEVFLKLSCCFDDHCIYYCGQESLQKKGSRNHSQQDSPNCSSWVQSQKWQNDLCLFPRQPFNITVTQVFVLTSNAEEAEFEQFYEDLQELLELTPKKDVLFIIGDWNAKVGSQETPGVTGKFCLGIWNEPGQRLIMFAKKMDLS